MPRDIPTLLHDIFGFTTFRGVQEQVVGRVHVTCPAPVVHEPERVEAVHLAVVVAVVVVLDVR